MTDTTKKKRHVVFAGKRHIVGVANVVDEEEFNQLDEIPPFSTTIVPRLSSTEKTPYLCSDHNEGIHVKKAKFEFLVSSNLNF